MHVLPCTIVIPARMLVQDHVLHNLSFCVQLHVLSSTIHQYHIPACDGS